MKWDNTKRLQADYIIGKEVSEEKYHEMMGCLPPEAMVSNAFLVGEPTDHKNGLPRYELYFTKNNLFYSGGLTTEKDFILWLIPNDANEPGEGRMLKNENETAIPPSKAELMAEENGLSEEINQSYINIVGEEYAAAEQAQEAYSGKYSSDEEFAQETAEQLGEIDKEAKWPNSCIDWKFAAKELMYDYSEDGGHYFINL